MRVRPYEVGVLCELQSTVDVRSVTRALATPVSVHLAACFPVWGAKMGRKQQRVWWFCCK